jgi:hypothetical protein
MLKSRRGDKFANYFAKPTVDHDAGELRWTAEVPGAARAWSAMTGEEQAQRALDLEVIRSGLLGYAQELRAQGGSGPGGAAAFASLLEQAMKVPAQGDFLYFVGDQPVIAFWGFEDASGGSVDPSAQAPRYAGPPVVAPAPATAAPAVAAGAVARGRRPWWWLWWLLGALLLLGLLLLLPRACTPDGRLDLKRALPGAPGPDAAASLPRLDDTQRVAQGGAGTSGGAAGTAGGPDSEPPGGASPDPDAGAPPTMPDAAASAGLAPGENAPPPGNDESPRPTEPPQPPQPELKPGDPPASPRPDAKEPGGTKPPLPGDAKTMKLPDSPESARKLDFLEGRWKAGEGLFDTKTGQPLDLSLKFDKEGKGEVQLRRPDGTVCRGGVQGRMGGGKLGIEGSQSIPCSDGSTHGAPKIECQKERGGQTQCYGINADGSRYFMDMSRP